MENKTETEIRHDKLEAVWKGDKCVVCQFTLDQSEFDEIVETPEGYCHRDCLDDDTEEYRELNK